MSLPRPAQAPGQQKAERRQSVQDETVPQVLAALKKVELSHNGQAQRGCQ
jgi:hypothetical protein